MGIYNLSDMKQLIGSTKSLKSIENASVVLKQKTGLTIDEYGTTRLYSNHIEMLNDFTGDSSERKDIFLKAIDSNIGLLIEGD